MPGVDLLDAFAELVVCVVFNLPHDDPKASNSSDNDDNAAGTNSSGTTQIFSRDNSFSGSQSQGSLQLTPNSRDMAAFTNVGGGSSSFACGGPLLSEANSSQSLDLYPGGIWNPIAGLPPHQHNLSAAATGGSSITTRNPHSSHPSSIASLNTGDIYTPHSSGVSADRSVGFWSRLLGSSSVMQTPPRTSSYGQLPNTGVTTSASSYVQLTEEDLGIVNTSGRVGGASCWTGFSASPSMTQYSSPQQLDLNVGDNRGAPSSNLSTPLYESSPRASSTALPPPTPSSQLQSQQQLPPRLNPHSLHTGAQRLPPQQEGRSRTSSCSEFLVL